MHICFLCNEFPPGKHGGIGSFTRTLGRRLGARGHKVTVVGLYSLTEIEIEQDAGVGVWRLPSTRVRGMGFWLNGARLRRALRTLHAKIPIDLLEGAEDGFALLASKTHGTKVIRM